VLPGQARGEETVFTVFLPPHEYRAFERRKGGTSGPSARAVAVNQKLGRGVNIIGYDPLWRSKARARFQDAHFKLIREAGFLSVRINLHPFQYARADAQGTIGRTWFDTLDWAVEQSLANRLMVVLDFHEFTQMGRDPEGNRQRFLAKLDLPEDDRNLILTVHYYSPFEFTHQGASWTGQRDKIGIPWNGTPKERQSIERDFQQAQAWAQKHNRPVYLGEFGAYDKADMDSRGRYVGFVARHAEKLGWSWAYWQFGSDFIVYDIPKNRWIEPIRDALIPPKP
jgi:aryl-phospho-beta-D-glucosidase BglC (GH1 family)